MADAEEELENTNEATGVENKFCESAARLRQRGEVARCQTEEWGISPV